MAQIVIKHKQLKSDVKQMAPKGDIGPDSIDQLTQNQLNATGAGQDHFKEVRARVENALVAKYNYTKKGDGYTPLERGAYHTG